MSDSRDIMDGWSGSPFSEALRFLMQQRGISYRKLATRTSLSAGYLNHLACGTRPVPSDKVIKNLARALRTRPDYFLEYRLRRLDTALARDPGLLDNLYRYIVEDGGSSSRLSKYLKTARKTS